MYFTLGVVSHKKRPLTDKINTNLCAVIALYVGLAIANSLEAVCVMLNPLMYNSNGTGRTLGWKLKVAFGVQPSQLATSFALAIEAPKAMIRMGLSNCEDMYLILEQMISINKDH